MTRLHKKCLIASTSLHALLAFVLVFGSAFFVARDKQLPQPRLQFVPSRFIEAALAGGGGNPNIARTDDIQKGSPTAPVPPKPPTPTPPKPNPVREADPPPPPPKPTPKPVETKVDPPKVDSVKPPKPTDVAKPTEKAAPKRKIDLTELKLVAKDDTEKVKAKAEAEARAEAQRIAQANRRKLGEQFNNAATDLQRGFQHGTKVDVGGPGGEAFANYGALVQARYEAAWQVIQDLSDDDAITLVKVTIARDGRVLSSLILRKSGNATMDRSVQRALDRVRDEHLPPFPDFIKDLERTFTIEFNLKTKKLLG
jgi:colicin import membrane protein